MSTRDDGGPAVGELIIGETHPNDGSDWENQCARCGSSVMWEECDTCGGEGVDGHDCGEDCCCCEYPEDNMKCDVCDGSGGWWSCISSVAHCEDNPIPGREKIKRGRVEWFRVPAARKETT